MHIFWQKRICDGDQTTNWWYPFQTAGGAIRADRLVFPIPEGVHWSEVKAVELPGAETKCTTGFQPVISTEKHGLKTRGTKKKDAGGTSPLPAPRGGRVLRPMGGFRFDSEVSATAPQVAMGASRESVKAAKPRAARGEKIDPKYLAAARELRDRYLEHVNLSGVGLVAGGKYDVTRVLPETKKSSRTGRQWHLSATATASRALPAA